MTRTALPQVALMTASPDEAEAQFYEAMQQGQLDRMMAVWADDEDAVCVHPGGPRIVGTASIRHGFESLFNQCAVDVEPQHVRRQILGQVAIHHVLERIKVGGPDPEGPRYGYVLATNVYIQTPLGWRLLVHHASPGSPHEPLDLEPVQGLLH